MSKKCQEVNTSRFEKVLKLRHEAANILRGVEQDFLEVPSMMLEIFVWQPEVLKRLSSNVVDGTSLPDATIKALNESRMLMTGYAKTKYLALALYDLRVHAAAGPTVASEESNPYLFDGKPHDVVSLLNAMMKQYTGIEQIPGSYEELLGFI